MNRIRFIVLAAAVVMCAVCRESDYMFLIPLAGMTLMYISVAVERKQEEKKISHLIKYLTDVQDNLSLPLPSESEEGSYGILQSEIYKVVAMLRECCANESRQKKYTADMFLDISHQIKTPLTAVSMMAQLLEQPEVTDQKRAEYAASIDKQALKIKWLVKNILTLSQFEADVIELKRENVRVSEIMKQIRETFEIMSEVKETELDIQYSDDITIICDRQWTTEAISNIVKNAIEHTPSGGKIEIRTTQDNIASNIYIKDNGEGISREHMSHIFGRFYKISPSSESVGIGLALAKQIICRQDGRISAESEIGKGTEFHIKLYRRPR